MRFVLVWLLLLFVTEPLPASGQEVLPAPTPLFKGKIAQSIKDATPDFPQPVHAPHEAPNIHSSARLIQLGLPEEGST